MTKPTKKSKTYYDWLECEDYIQKQHKCNIRDFKNKFKKIKGKLTVDDKKEYMDFWHWVLNNYEVHNGCFITFTKEIYESINEEWIKTIYGWFLEFADEGEVEFYVTW